MKRPNVPIAPTMELEVPRQPRRSHAPRRGWVVLAVGAVVLGLVGGPAAAQDGSSLDAPKTGAALEDAKAALDETLALAPEDSPPSPDDPFQAVVDAREVVTATAFARLDVTSRSNDANQKALVAAEQLKAAKNKETEAFLLRQAAIEELATERERLSDLTVT